MTEMIPDHLNQLLRGIDSPTISNAEIPGPQADGGLRLRELACRFPELPPMAGDVVTSVVDTRRCDNKSSLTISQKVHRVTRHSTV